MRNVTDMGTLFLRKNKLNLEPAVKKQSLQEPILSKAHVPNNFPLPNGLHTVFSRPVGVKCSIAKM